MQAALQVSKTEEAEKKTTQIMNHHPQHPLQQ